MASPTEPSCLSPTKSASKTTKDDSAPSKETLSSTKKRRFETVPTKTEPKLLVKLLSDQAVPPKRSSALAAGYDLASAGSYVIPPQGRTLVKTDIAIALPVGTYGRIAPRSGLAVKSGIGVGGGVIDADYRGPVGVCLFNHSDTELTIQQGDRVAQLVIEVIQTPLVEVVEALDETERGESGFGSTGVATDVTNTHEEN